MGGSQAPAAALWSNDTQGCWQGRHTREDDAFIEGPIQPGDKAQELPLSSLESVKRRPVTSVCSGSGTWWGTQGPILKGIGHLTPICFNGSPALTPSVFQACWPKGSVALSWC